MSKSIVIFYIAASIIICFIFTQANREGSQIFALGGIGPSKPTGPGQHHK